jgi:hypothetical protein
METESELPFSKELFTGPYPEPDKSSPPTLISPRPTFLILSTHLRLALPNGLFPEIPLEI